MLAQLPRNREPVFARQAKVEQHQLRRVRRHQAQQRRTVVSL